jgi:hypothetical protein
MNVLDGCESQSKDVGGYKSNISKASKSMNIQ